MPLGHTADIGGQFTLKVDSARSTAVGAQPVARLVPCRSCWGIEAAATPMRPWTRVVFRMPWGRHNGLYQWQSCGGNDLWHQRAILDGITVFSGGQQRAQMCFEVAANDVSTLQLHLRGEGVCGRARSSRHDV